MAKKPKYKFIAKPVSSIKLLEDKEKFSNDDEISEEPEFSADNTFNLDELNISNLTKALSKSANKRFKSFLFTQERENQRVILKTEHIKLLKDAFCELRHLGSEIQELKADAIISPITLHYLSLGKKIDLKHTIELKIEQQKTIINSERIKREKEELELLDKKADIALKEADAAFKNALTKEQEQNALFVKNIAEDLKNLPPGIKLAMWHDFMSRHKQSIDSNEPKDVEFDDFLKDMKKKFFEEDLKQEKAKTKSEEAQADHDKWRTDKKQGKL